MILSFTRLDEHWTSATEKRFRSVLGFSAFCCSWRSKQHVQTAWPLGVFMCVCDLCVCLCVACTPVHIHTNTHPPSVHYRQLNQEGEEYFSWCYFYDNLFRWLIWFKTLIYHQFIDLSLSFYCPIWIIRMARVKWNFLAYCSASHTASVVQTIKWSIKLIYTQSERGKRGTETEKTGNVLELDATFISLWWSSESKFTCRGGIHEAWKCCPLVWKEV